MDIGIWGMGRMGFNMVRRLVDKGDHRVIAGNRSPGKVDEAVEHGAEGAYSVEEFVGMQESPRVLWTMLPAGDVTDDMVRQFTELADEGDIIVDGANSYFRDSVARAREVRNAGKRWLDAGVSGGVWGYDVGYCTMIGGDADAFEYVEPAFETLAPPERLRLPRGRGRRTLRQDGPQRGRVRDAPGLRRRVRDPRRSPATTTTSGPSPACGTRGASSAAGSSSSPRAPSRRTPTSTASAATSRTPARGAGRCSKR